MLCDREDLASLQLYCCSLWRHEVVTNFPKSANVHMPAFSQLVPEGQTHGRLAGLGSDRQSGCQLWTERH